MSESAHTHPRLSEVIQQVEDVIAGTSEFLPANVVRNWLQSNDLEILGAASHVLLTKTLSEKITPELTLQEQHVFLLQYWRRCVVENREDEWTSSRYMALHEAKDWFRLLWVDEEKNDDLLREMKRWFEELLSSPDSDIRLSVVHGAIEHLFERKDVIPFFSDWKDDESLSTQFEKASLWKKPRGPQRT